MLVKESSDLNLQLSCVVQLAHRNGVFKKFTLNSRRQIVPLHDDCGAQTPQHMLLFLGEGSHVVASFLRCAFCSAALVIPSCEGIGLVRAFACAVRHRLALSSYSPGSGGGLHASRRLLLPSGHLALSASELLAG